MQPGPPISDEQTGKLPIPLRRPDQPFIDLVNQRIDAAHILEAALLRLEPKLLQLFQDRKHLLFVVVYRLLFIDGVGGEAADAGQKFRLLIRPGNG